MISPYRLTAPLAPPRIERSKLAKLWTRFKRRWALLMSNDQKKVRINERERRQALGPLGKANRWRYPVPPAIIWE